MLSYDFCKDHLKAEWNPLRLCREELLLLREDADKKISQLEGKCQELQAVIQQVSEDFQKVGPEHKLQTDTLLPLH